MKTILTGLLVFIGLTSSMASADFRGEEDETVYVWMRRFESEAQREQLYKDVYESEEWTNHFAPRIGGLMDRDGINVQRILPTPRSVTQ